ncbi:MAG TPA: OmpW family outer membrane protein [Thermoanaerobaculia bacterium]|jgi:opacity protein-like surface antigen
MHTRFATLLLCCLALTAPLFAQSNALTLWLTTSHNADGGPVGDPADNLRAQFDDGSGYGASYSRALPHRLSAEIAAFRVSAGASLRDPDETVSAGDVEITPITAMLRLDVIRAGAFSAHVGAGAAYVMVDDLSSRELQFAGAGTINLDDETTYVAGAGAEWSFGRWAIAADARYLPLTLHAPNGEVDLDPLLLSAGVRVRF